MRVSDPPPQGEPARLRPDAELEPPDDRREARILDAQALLIQVTAVHLAMVKKYAGTQPALRQESDIILPLLMEARNQLGAGWAANEAATSPAPPTEVTVFAGLIRELNAGGWTQATLRAWLAGLEPMLAGVPA